VNDYGFGLVISGGDLFVSNANLGTIGEYDLATGLPINASLVTGLNTPGEIAVSGGNLFVANSGDGTIGEYDANSGAVVNAALISGLDGPFGLVVTTPEPSTWGMSLVGAATLLAVPLRMRA
jgi:hypothetical protein